MVNLIAVKSNFTTMLFAIMVFSCIIKIYLLAFLAPHSIRTKSTATTWIMLLGVIIGSCFGDIAWIVKLMRESIAPDLAYPVVIFFVRLSWAMLTIQYQALSLFMQGLVEKKIRLRSYNALMIVTSGIIACYFFFEAFCDARLTSIVNRENAFIPGMEIPLEIRMMLYTSVYILLALAIPSFITTCMHLRSAHLPLILRKQLKIFLIFFMLPYMFIEALIASSMSIKMFSTHYYPTVMISTLLLNCALYYCIRRVIGLRFLNSSNHVQAAPSFNFVQNFNEILIQLSHATTNNELTYTTKSFFDKAHAIPMHKTSLFTRSKKQEQETCPNILETIVEQTLAEHETNFLSALYEAKILIYDELAFTNFYEENSTRTALLIFLQTLNADIFLPLYEKENIVGYIIIERNARPETIYSNVERDEMLVFASYLENIINLTQYRSIESLIHQEKELNEELYNKQQEINQYKESLRSFLYNNKTNELGIIFYKNRHFIFANQAAKDMIGINLNALNGHPLTQALKKLMRNVEEYQQGQTCFIFDKNGNKLIASATPNLESTHTIITISHPDIADIIAKHSARLKDPSQCDYILYLETTKSGQLINQLIPGSSPTLLSFKIELLKLALSSKALLLEVPEEDTIPFVELIHHISLRTTLHTMNLKEPCRTNKETICLFGINALFPQPSTTQPLLEYLNETGTIFIHNIDFLTLETQHMLAEFLACGFYREYKGTKKHQSSARIICSTNRDLQTLVNEGAFAAELFSELKKTSLTMPSLATLSDKEMASLADDFSEQVLQANDFKNLLTLTEKEKNKLASTRPLSLQELKTRVQNIIVQKSKQHDIFHETQFDPTYTITNPELFTAARLGKQALRDPKIMTMLWATFKSQSKIASFLGVNRSSVNRRCKKQDKEFLCAP